MGKRSDLRQGNDASDAQGPACDAEPELDTDASGEVRCGEALLTVDAIVSYSGLSWTYIKQLHVSYNFPLLSFGDDKRPRWLSSRTAIDRWFQDITVS